MRKRCFPSGPKWSEKTDSLVISLMRRKIGAKDIVWYMCPEWYQKIIIRISPMIFAAGLARDGLSEKTDRLLPTIPPMT